MPYKHKNTGNVIDNRHFDRLRSSDKLYYVYTNEDEEIKDTVNRPGSLLKPEKLEERDFFNDEEFNEEDLETDEDGIEEEFEDDGDIEGTGETEEEYQARIQHDRDMDGNKI